MPEEAKILDLFKQGKKNEAFQILVTSNTNMLYSHVYKMTNNSADTSDILQNTFLKAWKYIDSFKNQSKYSTWLFKIASNETYTFFKKIKNTVEIDHAPIQSDNSLSVTIDAEEILQKAIDSLPPKQKQVFIMRYYDEIKYEEMSMVLETSVGALKASYHQAVKKIEAIVKEN